jgi:Ca2+-binding EF-hand superfamily protein
MVRGVIELLMLYVLPVQGARHLMFGLVRTSRAPRWHAFSQYLHDVAADVLEAEPYVKSAGVLETLMNSSEGESLHLAPGQFLIAQKLFNEKLDADGDGVLSKSEFLNAVSKTNVQDPRLLEVGRDIFKFFSSKGVMSKMQFFRFFSICVVEPSEPGVGSFALKPSTLSGLTLNERSCLAKLFAVLDDNADGEVDKSEFARGYAGDLLRRLRQEGYVNCGPSSYQLQQVAEKLNQASGGRPLSIDRFYELTAQVAGEKPKFSSKSDAAQLSWCPRQIGWMTGALLFLM